MEILCVLQNFLIHCSEPLTPRVIIHPLNWEYVWVPCSDPSHVQAVRGNTTWVSLLEMAMKVVSSGSWLGPWSGDPAPEPPPLPLQIRAEDRFLRTEQGLLLRALQLGDRGLYSCTATENNFKHIVTRVQLHVLGRDAVHAALFPPLAVSVPPPPGTGLPTPPYQELAQLLAQPEVGLIHQYCQGYWRHVPPNPREAPGALRPPESQDQKKPRNRRHHPPDT